jgi:hypothetical protein
VDVVRLGDAEERQCGDQTDVEGAALHRALLRDARARSRWPASPRGRTESTAPCRGCQAAPAERMSQVGSRIAEKGDKVGPACRPRGEIPLRAGKIPTASPGAPGRGCPDYNDLALASDLLSRDHAESRTPQHPG